jgi:hypothetical protein
MLEHVTIRTFQDVCAMFQDFVNEFSGSANLIHLAKNDTMTAKAVRPAQFTRATHKTWCKGLCNSVRNHLRVFECLIEI